MKTCLRCDSKINILDVSTIGLALLHFVCDVCRRDASPWEFSSLKGGIPVMVRDMETGIQSGSDRLFIEPFDDSHN